MSKKIKKSPPKNPKNQKSEIKKKKSPQKLKGIIMIVAGILILVAAASLILCKTGPKDISKLLPGDKTIGFIEVNTRSQQALSANELLKKYEPYSESAFKKSIYELIGVNFDGADFWGEKMGMALIKSENNQPHIAIFISVKDKSQAFKFLESLALTEKGDEFLCEDTNGYQVCNYTFSYSVHLTFIEDYMVITPSQHKQTLLTLMDIGKTVSGDPKFIQVRNNLPAKNLAFAYIDAETLLSSLFESKEFVAKKGYELSALAPFLTIFKSHGIALIAKDKHFAAQTYTNIDKTKIEDHKFLSFDKKYKANLANYTHGKPLMYFGGQNITNQLKRLTKILSGDQKTQEILLESVLKAQIAKYLGEDISLEEDIYPIAEGEYAISMEGTRENPEYKFLLELGNPEADIPKIQKLLSNFVDINAVFEPKVVEIELEDGTKAKEIIASKEEVEESRDTYKSTDIISLKLGEKTWGIHYAFIDNIAIFASSKESVKASVDLVKDPKGSFKQSYPFEVLVKEVMRSGDEISFVDFDVLMGKLGLKGDWLKYLSPIGTTVSSKNFFDDGIASTHFILLK